jgi:uncharacterized DUF497 family protein
MVINGLIWDIWNIQHITIHGVTTDEVEEVLGNPYVELRGRFGRHMMIGKTDTGRLLRVIIEQRQDNDIYYVISAFDASKENRRLYVSLYAEGRPYAQHEDE